MVKKLKRVGNLLTNIFDEVNRLDEAFRNTEEFLTLKQAIEIVRQDDEARKLFTNFRDVQVKLQQKQAAGELQEEDVIYAQQIAQQAQQNGKIIAMLEAEMALSKIIEELNRKLITPIQEMYDGL